jgi:hypothetical protein
MIESPVKPKTIVTGVAILILAGLLLPMLYAWRIQHQASRLLDDLLTLSVGAASRDDAERIVRLHRNLLANQNCQNAKCEYTFKVTNRWLSALHLEPDAQFRAGITVENGTVVRVGAGLMRSMDIYPTFNASAGMVEEYAEMPKFHSGEGHYGFPTPIGKPYLRVILDRHADAVQKKHAFAFSFKCLTKPGGGCDLSCDYLPLAWRDWSADLQTTGFPMSDFDQAYPNNKRCK